ncbi:MAG TPA: lytic transglycosylase domain-containing protein [Caulobacteraceae bacterium]
MAGVREALAAAAVLLAAGAAAPAVAQPLAALSAHDLSLYASAFNAAERGDSATAEAAVALVSDPCLAGKVRYLEMTHDASRGPTYQQLSNWLKMFGDMPGASQVYEMALRLKPADAPPPAPIATLVGAADGSFHVAPAAQSKAAREAYFGGDAPRALELARSAGDAWIAGLAAYRLGQYADAMLSFERLAANPSEDDATRAAGGVWAAKAAVAAGMPDRAEPLLKLAAKAHPAGFYGMIAQRKLELADDPLGRVIDAAMQGAPPPAALAPAQPGESALDKLVRTDPRARRAVALMQLQRPNDASAEVRAGMSEARDDATRGLWMNLMFELNPERQTGEIALHPVVAMSPSGGQAAYPTPTLAPEGGFTIDKALVYAVVWQESRFNSLAVSRVGAVGMMQLMPTSAASVAGDPTLKSDPITLFDVGKNLELGQAYITWIEQNAGGFDLLRTIAAYNGGPSTVAKTEALLGGGADSLLVIESVPFAETRAYVKKVAAAYWTYRRQFGAATKTLDAAASGFARVDMRLDTPAPAASAPTPAGLQDAQAAAAARQALEILLHHDS